MVEEKYSLVYILLVVAMLFGNVSISTASSDSFCFDNGCHQGSDLSVNASLFNDSSHKYLECIDCHLNVTEYPNSTHGNLTSTLTLPLLSTSYNSSDYLLCYGCHKESSLLGLRATYSNDLWTHTTVSDYPLTVLNISTNFVNELSSGHNFGNDPSNIHWDHLDLHKIDAGEGPDLIWDSNRNGTLDSMISCPACHDPHGNANGPNLTREDLGIQHGTDSNGVYGEVTNIEYLRAGGDLYCVGCHGIGVKYYRPTREVLNFSDLHISPTNMTSCIQSGCHYSNVLTTEHIEKRDLACATCHQSSEQRVSDAIQEGDKSCLSCHTPHTSGSHTTHIDAARGPYITCSDCHGTQIPPLFADEQTLENTDVCDTCHSPDGIYDGMDDNDIGARDNWAGVYNNSSGTLNVGKEKWCAGCHDSQPATIEGVEAPNVVGDGSDYGYYVTGHGENEIVECSSCHDLSSMHIDGISRTYSPDSNYTTYDPESAAYQDGYRLRNVSSGYDGKYPMHIPRTGNVFPPGFRKEWEFALCFECHSKTRLFNGGYPENGSDAGTNFRENYSGNWLSLHDLHTDGRNGPWGPATSQYDSDFNGTADSRISCPACHNVHGSRSPAMVRTGELIGKTPALNLKYVDNSPGDPLNFISRDQLDESTGAGMDVSFGPGTLASNGVCNMCHAQQTGGPQPYTAYYRDPIVNVLIFSDLHISSTNMTSCIQSGCHYSNVLTIEHVEMRGMECDTCHQSSKERVINSIRQDNTACFSCHESHNTGSHSTHIEAENGPQISCPDCHSNTSLPLFADEQNLNDTTVCNTCHSPDGTYDGMNDSQIGARYNWDGVYNDSDNTLKLGKEKWCIGCHDDDPSVISGETAPNKAGDNSTYGYYVTGHGQVSNYSLMSWQADSAIRNPGANQSCVECHNTTSDHIVSGANPDTRRLKSGYENDQNNTNCNNCHALSGSATADPQFYTNSSDYENSAHGGKKCTECHEVHGTSGAYKAMTKGDRQSLCYQCHTEGNVMNDAISNNRPGGYNSADDIEQAFGKSTKHNLGTSFTLNSKNYTLECVSCHNVHIINGKYWDAEDGSKSPITRFTDNTKLWGDEPGEKMDDFAALGSGTGGWYFSIARGSSIVFDQPAVYQPPKNGSGYNFEFEGDVLPDYTTFCLDCHSYRVSAAIPPVNWGQGIGCTGNSVDPPNQRVECGGQHGLGVAGKPYYISDTGTAGFWGSSGNPDVIFQMNYVTRGRHNGHFMRWPYDSADRSAGINFVLSCTDCHEAHGSDRGSMIRERFSVNANGDCGTGGNSDPDGENCNDGGNWNSFCNACHYYYGGQHAGMSCGTASCHEANSIHRIIHNTDSGGGTQLMLTAAGYEANYSRPAFTPEINTVIGYIGSNKLVVDFTDGVWTNSDLTGALEAGDFWLIDINSDNPRTITGVNHTAGGSTATITMSAPLIGADLSNDILTTTGKSVWKWYEGGYNNYATGVIGPQAVSAGPWPMTITARPPPAITSVKGRVGRDWVIVTFSSGVYTDPGQSGALESGDFNLTDNDNSRTILSVIHSPGNTTANLTLSSALDSTEDILMDTLAVATANSIYDMYNLTVPTDPVTITTDLECPIGTTVFQLNESSGNTIATDDQVVIVGTVNDPTETFLGDGYFHGDGIDNYIDFNNNSQCLKATTAMTLEARIKPSIVDDGDGNTIQRVFAKAGTNYQMSVWRNNNSGNYPNYQPPDGVASIAFWVKPVDAHDGLLWKPVLTNYTDYPIVADHWYKVKVVWNSSKTGGIPCDIFVDDQGTDGNDTSENWSGYINATDFNQSQLTSDRKLYEGDIMNSADGVMNIGSSANHNANLMFNGSIDWIKWQGIADYSGVD